MATFPLEQAILLVGFVDNEATERIARSGDAEFDKNGIATIRLSQEDGKYVIHAVAAPEPASDTVRKGQFSIEHLASVVQDIVPRISEAYTRLGLTTPASKDEVTHDAILKLLRTALRRAIELPPAKTRDSGTEPLIDDDVQPMSLVLDGMDRDTLALGSRAALKALFERIRQDGLTAVADFTAWADAEGVLPADGIYTEAARSKIAACMIRKIEHPPKFAAGVHETVKPQSAAA